MPKILVIPLCSTFCGELRPSFMTMPGTQPVFMREKGPLNNSQNSTNNQTQIALLFKAQESKIGNVILVWFGLIFLGFGLIFLWFWLDFSMMWVDFSDFSMVWLDCFLQHFELLWLETDWIHRQDINKISFDHIQFYPWCPDQNGVSKAFFSSTQYRGRLCLPAGTSTLVVPGHGMAGPQTPPHCQIISTKPD